jgi:hypothetical protein
MSLTTCLALLVKLPSILISIPMLYMAWKKSGAHCLLQRELWAFAAFSLVGPLAWYTHVYSISLAHVPYHFFGSGGIAIESLAGMWAHLWVGWGYWVMYDWHMRRSWFSYPPPKVFCILVARQLPVVALAALGFLYEFGLNTVHRDALLSETSDRSFRRAGDAQSPTGHY